ncbi:MAG: tetratricopeptide repeat protein [Bryobacteraceae bacterium]
MPLVALLAQAHITEMKKMEILAGRWEGSGWMQMGSQREAFRSVETVEVKLGGAALLIEGTHRDGERIVHHALAVLSWDNSTKTYRFRSQLATGQLGDYEAKAIDGGMEWGMSTPRGKMRYTIRIIDGKRWQEIGEFDAGGTWRQFFEMTLEKVTPAGRFDHKVRNDFFAGFTGNPEALERGMKACEEVLAENPKHAEALVWHGAGLFFRSGMLFQKQDVQNAMPLYQKGLQEMEAAVALDPKAVGVRIPRGATLFGAARGMRNAEMARPLIEKAVSDYETVYEIQKPYLDKLGDHPRGELLIGLADGYDRLGKTDKAKQFFEMLLAAGPKSGHMDRAKEWLETGKLSKPVQCVGCHVAK